ncbi:hypothetical protein L7F22_061266 [Adiantum nelumboides]|nr:hypothetical protein [Adiantum nelumboides]
MVGSLEKEDYYIKKFDGTKFIIWKQRMMDVLVNKGLAAPLKDRKEGVYNDDQWEDLNARAKATTHLHLGKSIFFTIMDKTIDFELWDSLCSAWDGKSASNNVFLMKKLMWLSMKEGSSVSSHLNEFNALYLQLPSKGLNFNDEMKAIFLLCSLPASWDTFNTAINNSTHGGKLAFGDVTSHSKPTIKNNKTMALGILDLSNVDTPDFEGLDEQRYVLEGLHADDLEGVQAPTLSRFCDANLKVVQDACLWNKRMLK